MTVNRRASRSGRLLDNSRDPGDRSCVSSGRSDIRELAIGVASLLVAFVDSRDTGSEPHAAGVANQEHRAGALRRRVGQRIIDPKISVRFERNTCERRAVLDEGSRRLANQRREHALVGVRADAIAAGEEQTAPSDPDAPVASTSALRLAILHGPAPGLTPLTMFARHVREGSIRVRRPGHQRIPESHQCRPRTSPASHAHMRSPDHRVRLPIESTVPSSPFGPPSVTRGIFTAALRESQTLPPLAPVLAVRCTHVHTSTSSPRLEAVSSALPDCVSSFSSAARNACRARDRRDMTVPIGMRNTSASSR